MPASVFYGCLAAVVLSGIQSLGITLQRKSHVIPYQHELHDDSVVNLRRDSVAFDPESSHKTHHYKRNLWLFGFLLFIVANVFGSLIQLTALPLIILSPLQSIGLIFNSILSCLLLPGERFTKKLAWGTVIIACGAFVIAYNGASAPAPPLDVNSDERFRMMLEKFRSPGFLSWWIFTFVYMGILVRVNWVLANHITRLQYQPLKKTHRSCRHGMDPAARLVFARGVLFGLVSGTLTAHTFLFAKSIVDVLVETVLGKSKPKGLFTYIITVLLLVVTLSIVGMQLVAFNMGLSNILTAILYPLCFLVYNLVNLINDVSFNRLLSSGVMSASQLLLVIVGLSAVLCGVVMISWDSAFGRTGRETDEMRPLMSAKFPYEQIKTRGNRVLSYEESEIMSQFVSLDDYEVAH